MFIEQKELLRLRAEIESLEFRLIRLSTGRKAIRDTADAADHVRQRILELRTWAQELLTQYKAQQQKGA